MANVIVVGACGHIGLPFSIWLSRNFNTVIGYDINSEAVNNCNNGIMPFEEEGIDPIRDLLNNENLTFIDELSPSDIDWASHIVVIVGTPIRDDKTPDMTALFEVADILKVNDLTNKCIILRSTIYPGTTQLFFERLNQPYVTVDFCPERVAQGNAIKEFDQLPQIIGMGYGSNLDGKTFSSELFPGEKVFMTAKEAEFAKLMTNMHRYIEFAMANEFMVIGDSLGIKNVHYVMSQTKRNYPRLSSMKFPGPNVAGPCLSKDGHFLTARKDGQGIIDAAYNVNEKMPNWIVKKINEMDDVQTVLIEGLTFKRNSDDVRNTLSFKLKNLLENEGYDVYMYDPFFTKYNKAVYSVDLVVVMTDHDYKCNFKSFKYEFNPWVSNDIRRNNENISDG